MGFQFENENRTDTEVIKYFWNQLNRYISEITKTMQDEEQNAEEMHNEYNFEPIKYLFQNHTFPKSLDDIRMLPFFGYLESLIDF
jgi:hypothetical protein